MDKPSLQTSEEVWDFLLSQGEIDLKSYDLDIVNVMRGSLNIPYLGLIICNTINFLLRNIDNFAKIYFWNV